MSDFRAVKEIWGVHSATFVDSDALVRILNMIADEAGLTCSDEHAYGMSVFWVEDGKDFLEAVKKLNDTDFDMFDQGDEAAGERTRPLVQNMKALADQWLAESLNPDGSLRFYVDD